ncbi:MAG TPA: arylamine N-acetyltransferase [Blastocatellia bacterium]|nr:arylamine N-acetyltransferase [Blastocatellia bacterium]
MDVQAYLTRIRYSGPLGVSLQTLRYLHRSHLLAVPFENLDIALGRPIILDEDRLFTKIVENRRGGFCYELNGLFGSLLRALGFEVKMISAGVAREAGGFGPEFDHMALQVGLGDSWLADVGFGDSFLEPIPLVDSIVTQDPTGAYRVDPEGLLYQVMLRCDDPGNWKPQYRFSLTRREFTDYEEMCLYHQTSPNSSFTQGRVCSLATETGRITLSGTKLIETNRRVRTERTLSSEDEARKILSELFDVSI